MNSSVKFKKPTVMWTTQHPDGTTVSVEMKWDEVHGGEPEDVRLISEYQYIHNTFLSRESDRAAAVLAPALLDSALEILLRHFMLTTNTTDALLDSDRALGTFSSRINAAHSLGLIADDVAHDLDSIRRIRNIFAHDIAIHSFDDPTVADRCRELQLKGRWGDKSTVKAPGDARREFMFSTWAAMLFIAKALRASTKVQLVVVT